MEIKTIGIIGAGKMGQDIFYFLTDYDFKIKLFCNEKSFDLQKEKFDKKIEKKKSTGLIDEIEADRIKKNIKIINDYDEIKECSLIIEAISEDIDKKKKLFSMLDNIVDDSCIFTTNTSSLKPDELAPSQKRSSNFAGLHFFYPVKMKSMLELNKSSKTDDLTIKKINNFAKKINKKIIILEDDNCFLLNKIFLDFQSEAFNLKDEFNLNFLQIDHIIRKSIFPIGVFEFFDSVGIDVMYSAIKNYIKDYNNREYYINMVNMLKSMINNNELGKKTKKGFYDYKESAKNDEHFVSENIEKIINKRLISVFLKSFSKFQKSSKIKSEILNECIKDYMSCDYGPLEMIMQDKIIYQ